MEKYYTRACNFYHGEIAKKLVKKKKALPLCGKKSIAFDTLEIFIKNEKRITSKLIHIKNINKLKYKLKKEVKNSLNKIIKRRKNFLRKINFSKTSIMGILNLTPDSFSDGGKYNSKKKSLKQIKNLLKGGANIIDIGGESTRPGSKTIQALKEWKRIAFVVQNFKKNFKNTCVSIDTRKPEVIEKAIANDVDLINDVSGFKYSKSSIKVINKISIPKVLHHMQGTPNTMQTNPRYQNCLLDIYDYFEKNIKRFKYKNIILDPGIGFGKNLKHNLSLISKISLFHSLGFPILVGTSRKRFINQIAKNYDSEERIGGTLSSVLFLLSQGIQVFRVHNVREIKQGILVFEKILYEK
ncbi:MAG: dihydropteroate synthase [Candidatus Pelagibacter sp.]|nr:dihydropteroate synthase [Candidatus Pelagibacter sp.]OUW23902.1 MAG: dihydropteroate synthase [Rickettsiales bacterium TMED174]